MRSEASPFLIIVKAGEEIEAETLKLLSQLVDQFDQIVYN